jgi:lysophospholipase L1-like esterase
MSEGGSIGFYDYGATAFFDNFSVEMLPENDDYLNYFDYTSANTNSVILEWSLDEYDNVTIRRGTSRDTITTEIYHGSSTICTDNGLLTDTNYYYNITYNNSTQGHIIKAFTYNIPTTRKYVAIGDSISTDYGTLLVNESFPYLLNKTIVINNDSAVTHSISAIAGHTTNGIIFEELDDILTEKPTFITLMAGWNDFYQGHDKINYRANFKYIINESTKHGIHCFVLKMINTSDTTVQVHVHDTNTWIDSLGEQYVINTYDAIDLIPFDGIIQGYNSSFYQDGIHPNLDGTMNLNKSIWDYMISEGYFDSAESFVNPIFVTIVTGITAVVTVGAFIRSWFNRRRKRR